MTASVLIEARRGKTADHRQLKELTERFAALFSKGGKKRDHVETFITPVTCPSCGKHLEVEVVIVYGWREHETGECPVCETRVYEKNCWKIIPRLVKRLPTE